MNAYMTKKRTLTIFLLTMINIAAICNIKNYPLISLYGFSSIFFIALASILFFIPVALVSAELATGWPNRGIYIWVREALGPRLGFLAIWLQWIENIIWYPTILAFIAATFAYSFDPAFSENKLYVLLVILATFWTFTLLNLFGMKLSGWISAISVLIGTILPSIFILFLACIWYIRGNPIQTPITLQAFFPSLASINQLVIFTGVLLSLAGMEMSAVHALEVKNPAKDYPKAIFYSSLFILLLTSLGSISIAIVVPKENINLAAGVMEAFGYFLATHHLSHLLPIVACLMAFGGLGMMSTWIVGPVKGIFASALDGDLPKFLQKVNKKNMPVNLLFVQAIFVSLLSLVFLFMPDVSSSYWILVNLTIELYLIMYILMFISAIVLRYTSPHIPRAYTIPGRKWGIWIVSGIGGLASIFAFVLGLFPPEQIDIGKIVFYEAFLLGGLLFFCLIPHLIYLFRKKSWRSSSHL